MLARGSHNKDIKIWEVTTGTELMTLLGKDQYDHHWSVCVAFSPDGMHLASGTDIGKIKLWEVLPSGEEKSCITDTGSSTTMIPVKHAGTLSKTTVDFKSRWTTGSVRWPLPPMPNY